MLPPTTHRCSGEPKFVEQATARELRLQFFDESETLGEPNGAFIDPGGADTVFMETLGILLLSSGAGSPPVFDPQEPGVRQFREAEQSRRHGV